VIFGGVSLSWFLSCHPGINLSGPVSSGTTMGHAVFSRFTWLGKPLRECDFWVPNYGGKIPMEQFSSAYLADQGHYVQDLSWLFPFASFSYCQKLATNDDHRRVCKVSLVKVDLPLALI
jgi:hypothetical protein